MDRYQRPIRLYHYTKYETAIEKIFFNGTIRLGPLTLTNDPQESAIGGFAIGSDVGENVDTSMMFAMMERCKRLTTRPVRLACFTQDAHGPLINHGLPGHDHDRMWAQYAGVNTGVCIEFKADRLTASIEDHFRERIDSGRGRLIHGPVEYVKAFSVAGGMFFGLRIEEFTDEAIKRQRDERARERYFRKSVDWVSEQEYRYVWIDADDDYDADGEFVPIRGCVENIFLGARFPDPYRIVIDRICEAYEIEALQITYVIGHKQVIPVYPRRK